MVSWLGLTEHDFRHAAVAEQQVPLGIASLLLAIASVGHAKFVAGLQVQLLCLVRAAPFVVLVFP